jgi:hypothetical protein
VLSHPGSCSFCYNEGSQALKQWYKPPQFVNESKQILEGVLLECKRIELR